MDLTQPPLLYVVIAVAVVLVGLLVWAMVSSARKRREREELRERYGPEYDRTISQHRNKRAAVADLKEREAEHEHLSLRDLNDADRELVRSHMAAAQFRFVEDPADALMRTERVMVEVLRAKGYPVAEDREQATKLFSVDHPDHANHVRTMLDGDHSAGTDDLRDRFLQARKTIQEVAGVSFEAGDMSADRPQAAADDDLRVERQEPSTTPSGYRTS